MALPHRSTPHNPQKSKRSVDIDLVLKLLAVATLFGLSGFIGFLAGGLGTVMEVPPVSNFMRDTSMAIVAAYRERQDQELDRFWNPERLPLPASGNPVVTYDPAAAWGGLNLVIDTHAESATLVTMEGRPVHEWALRFVDIWDEPPQIPEFGEKGRDYWETRMYWRRVHLYSNGDLLVVFETPYRTPYGAGLAKIDRDSKLIWKFSENVHHHVAVAPDGRIYTLTQRIQDAGYKAVRGLKPPFIEDMVTIITPDGIRQKDIPIVAAFLKSDFAPLLDVLADNSVGDVTHANTVQYIDAGTAASLPFARAGQLLISMREMNVVAVLDPSTETIVWAATGLWRAQHEPVFLKNGRMLVYDNQGLGGIEGEARILEIDPNGLGVQWRYPGPGDEPLINPFYGSVQALPNGNVLIVETVNARAIEVTREGKIVWEYRSPHRKEAGGKVLVPFMPDLARVDPAGLDFLDSQY